MINRSKIKYSLKKILPSGLFYIVNLLWKKILLGLVTSFDNSRLKQFTSREVVNLKHKGITFKLYISR